MEKKTKKTMKQVLEAEARTLIEAEVKNFRANASKYIQTATLSLLGLEQDWGGKMEIDHCNGRNSVLIDAFRTIAKSEAEKIARTYKPSKEDVAGFQEAFAREYRSQMSYAMRDIVKAKVAADVAAYLNAHQINVSAIVEEVINK